MATLCVECKFLQQNDDALDNCASPDAPYTHFVYGHKKPALINTAGNCPFFQKKEG